MIQNTARRRPSADEPSARAHVEAVWWSESCNQNFQWLGHAVMHGLANGKPPTSIAFSESLKIEPGRIPPANA